MRPEWNCLVTEQTTKTNDLLLFVICFQTTKKTHHSRIYRLTTYSCFKRLHSFNIFTLTFVLETTNDRYIVRIFGMNYLIQSVNRNFILSVIFFSVTVVEIVTFWLHGFVWAQKPSTLSLQITTTYYSNSTN